VLTIGTVMGLTFHQWDGVVVVAVSYYLGLVRLAVLCGGIT
jgi:hypothetical protein